MSIREDLANDFASFLGKLKLNDSYGINVTKNKTFYSVTFCRARSVDGEVRIYGPKFIQIRFITAIKTLPHKVSEVFRDPQLAKDFLKECFQ